MPSSPTREAQRPAFVTAQRTETIIRITVTLALLGWFLRPVVGAFAPGDVVLHRVPVDAELVVGFIATPAVVVALLVVRCLNRVLLHAVAWLCAGCATNLGELLITGAVADYIPVRARLFSPGDVYLSVGIALLGLGALKVVHDGRHR